MTRPRLMLNLSTFSVTTNAIDHASGRRWLSKRCNTTREAHNYDPSPQRKQMTVRPLKCAYHDLCEAPPRAYPLCKQPRLDLRYILTRISGTPGLAVFVPMICPGVSLLLPVGDGYFLSQWVAAVLTRVLARHSTQPARVPQSQESRKRQPLVMRQASRNRVPTRFKGNCCRVYPSREQVLA